MIKYCRKCLLDETQEEYFEKLHRYIENLDCSDRVSSLIYEKRLAICRKCSWLSNGMCRLCGCFVELRAAIAVRKCPDSPERWSSCVNNVEKEVFL